MLYLRTFVEGLRTFHMHTLRTVCSDVGLRITTFYRIFFDAYMHAIFRHLVRESEMHRVHRHLTHSFSPPQADDAAGRWPSVRPSLARFRLEVCGNWFFVPIPSHFSDFIPILIPFPFPFIKSIDTYGCLGRIFLQAACCIPLLSTNSVRRKQTDDKMN